MLHAKGTQELAEKYGHAAAVITTDQAEAYKEACAREALEETAQGIEARIGQHAPGMTPEDVEDCDEEAWLCAGVVRTLIPTE